MAWNGKLFGVPVISKKACVRMAIGVSALAIGCGWLYYRGVMMPGSSYHGEFAALDAQETELATNLERHVTVLAGDIRQRNALYITGLERARDYIEAELTSYGYTDLERQTYAIDGSQMYTNDASFRGAMDGVEVWNVAAELRGQTRPEEILVIGAHYDSVDECPAANDNGSGVAATLELARMLHGKRLDRTVRFVFFTNEEPPYFQTSNMGSYQYAWHCQQRGDQVVGMLSLETMAYYVDDPRSQKYPSPLDKFYPSTGDFIGVVGSTASRDLVVDTLRAFRERGHFPSEGVSAPGAIQGIMWSDHWGFEQFGYPALMLTDTGPFRYPHYHGNDDTPDKLAYPQFARVVAILAPVVTDLATVK